MLVCVNLSYTGYVYAVYPKPAYEGEDVWHDSRRVYRCTMPFDCPHEAESAAAHFAKAHGYTHTPYCS